MQIEKYFDATVQVFCDRDLLSVIYKYLDNKDIIPSDIDTVTELSSSDDNSVNNNNPLKN